LTIRNSYVSLKGVDLKKKMLVITLAAVLLLGSSFAVRFVNLFNISIAPLQMANEIRQIDGRHIYYFFIQQTVYESVQLR